MTKFFNDSTRLSMTSSAMALGFALVVALPTAAYAQEATPNSEVTEAPEGDAAAEKADAAAKDTDEVNEAAEEKNAEKKVEKEAGSHEETKRDIKGDD